MSSAWFDYDGDGRPDLYVTNMWTACGQRLTRQKEFMPEAEDSIRLAYRLHAHGNALYRNQGDGRFAEIGAREGVQMGRWSWSGDAFDFDNDGWPAVTDIDGDGYPDLILKSRLGPQIRALRNNRGARHHSLILHLTGTQSNRDAIGSKVVVQTGGASAKRLICRFLHAGSGYLSQHSKLLYIGLGEHQRADKIRIEWPSGLKQEFQNLESGYRYAIEEGSEDIKRLPLRHNQADQPAIARAAPRWLPDNEPCAAPLWLLEPVPLPFPQTGPGFICLTDGRPVSRPPELPFEIVDLRKEGPDATACYALVRRYLYDWRPPLRVPLLFLIDTEGKVRKLYPEVPDSSVLSEDFRRLTRCDSAECRRQRALPFRGEYYRVPQRRYFQLGVAFYWAGYPEQALPYLTTALDRSPANFPTLLAVGQIHLELGRPAAARRYLSRALEINKESPELWNNLGGVEMAQENHQAALEHFERALTLQPDLAYALVNAGQAQARLGNLEKAEQFFRRALEIDETDADAANHLGLLLAQRNQFEEARRLFQRAITSQRNHAPAINNLGVLYVQEGKLNEAIAAFQYGIEAAPDHEDLYLNLARVYVQTARRERAREVLQRLLAHKPDSTRALRALQELGDR